VTSLPSVQADPTVARPTGRAAPRSVRVSLFAAGLLFGAIAHVDATGRGAATAEWSLIVLAAYSWAYLLAGAIAWERRPDSRVAALMTAVGVVAPAGHFAGSSLPVLYLAPWIGVPLMNVFLVWLILSYPHGRLRSRLYPALIGAIGLTLAISNVLAQLIGLQVLQYAAVLLISLAMSLLALVIHRWVSASPAARRGLTPMVVAGTLVAMLFAAEPLSFLLGIPIGPETPFRWAMLIARATVPVAYLVGLLNLRMARGAVAELVVGLDASRVGGLREALAQTLGDPSLEVAFWSPTRGRYEDADGAPVEVPEDDGDKGVILLEQSGERLGAIVHDPALAEDPGLISGVSAAIHMAVDNERLTATVRAQLEDVRASRMRIVEAADAERRRVERNLHDGAQQRLVALSLALRRARAQLPADAGGELEATLGGASEQLASALSELRDLARGIHPAILTEAGLGPALRSLARESPIPVSVTLALDDRLPDPVAVAAYFLAAEALANVAKYSAADHVAMSAVSTVDRLHMEVSDDGVGGADPAIGSGLRGLADRVAALGGLLEIHSPPGGGTRLVADLPLEVAGVE
jgi:signal transduction histidine kinase